MPLGEELTRSFSPSSQSGHWASFFLTVQIYSPLTPAHVLCLPPNHLSCLANKEKFKVIACLYLKCFQTADFVGACRFAWKEKAESFMS